VTTFPADCVIVEGDIERRVISVYTPDFYRDNPVFGTVNDILRSSVATLDYMLEKARGLRTLTTLDECPPDFLQHLGALVGYTWDPSLSVEGQREEIGKLVAVYQIRGTPASSIRIVLNAGARTADVHTPFESIAFADVSRWDSGARVEDEKFWRWGTYEVISDIDFSKIYGRLADVHPAGTVWYGRQLIASQPDEPVDPDEDIVQNTSVIHVVGDDYRTASAENYPEEVLNDGPEGYWRLDDSAVFEIASDSSGSTYGGAAYGSSGYGGGGGLFARDSSGNERHGEYAFEKDVIEYGDGVSMLWPTSQLLHPPVVPGQLTVTVETQVLHDDGAGNLTGDGSGTVDYTTGLLTNLKFNAPPGLGPDELPVLTAPTVLLSDHMQLWVDPSTITGVANAARVTVPFTESSPNGFSISPILSGTQPRWYTGTPAALLFSGSFEDSALRLPADLSLGTSHLIVVSAFMQTDGDCLFLGDSVNNCRFWYNDTTKKFGYRPNGGTDVFSDTFNFGDIGTFVVISVQRAGSAVSFFVNGTMIGSATLSGGNASAGFTCRNICGLGSSAPLTLRFDGTLYDLLAYTTVHSPQERLAIELFLMRKARIGYGLWGWYRAEAFDGLGEGAAINHWDDESGSISPSVLHGRNLLTGARAGLTPDTATATFTDNNANSLALPDGELVDLWIDLTTFLTTRNWSQATTGKKPTFVGSAQNGHPSLKFDGTKVLDQSADYGLTSGHTIVLALKFNFLGLTSQALLSDSTGNHFISYDPVTKKFTYQAGVGVSAVSDAHATGLEVGRWYTFAITRNAGTIDFWVNNLQLGAAKTITPSGTVFNVKHLGGSGSTPTSGFIGEISHVYINDVYFADVHRWYMDGFAREMGILQNSSALFLPNATPAGLPAVRSLGNSTDGAHLSLDVDLSNGRLYGIGNTFAFVFRIHQNLNGSGATVHYFTNFVYYDVSSKILTLETIGNNTWQWAVNIPLRQWHVLTIVRSNTQAEAFLNGVSLGVLTTALAAEEYFELYSVFDAFYANSGAIDLADMVLSDVAQDSSTVAKLMSHYATKHGIPTKSSASAVPIEAIYNDYVGRGYPGVLRAENTFCARFGFDDLVNRDIITLPVEDALAPRKHSWSAEFWVKSSLGLGGTIIGAYWGTYPNIYRINVRIDAAAGGFLSWELQDGSGGSTYTLLSNTRVNDDEWHHVVAVINVDHHKLEFYVDGQLDSSKVVSILGVVDFDLGAESFTIGGMSPDAPDRDFFRGDLDEIALYAGRLPTLSIQLHYAMGSGFNWTDESATTMLITNVEPIGSFGVRSFIVNQSVLDGTSQLDTTDIYDVVTGEAIRWVKNPAGAADRVGVVDFVNVNVVQAFERVKIGEALRIGIPVKDTIGVSDSVSATPEEGSE
jgi:hypothetical protein